MKRGQQVAKQIIISSPLTIFVLVLLRSSVVLTVTPTQVDRKINNHSCFTCVEPLVGYTDYPNSCRFFNVASPIAASYVKQCSDDDDDTNDINGEYECRLLIISYRSIDTYLRRDCAPKGRCSWKDRTLSMIDTPVSDCVYTDDHTQRLECAYCCDTPLCNRAVFRSRSRSVGLLSVIVLVYLWNRYKET